MLHVSHRRSSSYILVIAVMPRVNRDLELILTCMFFKQHKSTIHTHSTSKRHKTRDIYGGKDLWKRKVLRQECNRDRVIDSNDALFLATFIFFPLETGSRNKWLLVAFNRALLEQVINMYNCYNICRCIPLSLIHIWRCRRSTLCRSRWSPYH